MTTSWVGILKYISFYIYEETEGFFKRGFQNSCQKMKNTINLLRDSHKGFNDTTLKNDK